MAHGWPEHSSQLSDGDVCMDMTSFVVHLLKQWTDFGGQQASAAFVVPVMHHLPPDDCSPSRGSMKMSAGKATSSAFFVS
jgi:hypothetical protein